jgi:hypothetical protein
MRKLLLGAMALYVVGCGGGGHSGPRTYSLVNGVSFSVPAGFCTDVAGPFNVPTAYQDFDIFDTPVGLGVDSMEVGIMTEADLVASGGCDFNLAIADFQTSGAFTSPPGPLIPADAYDFIVGCRNVFDDCIFQLTWTATY